MFDCATTRILGMATNLLSTDLFIVRAFFFDVVKDLMLNGFYYNGEKYIYFTSSAGQIRTKKTMFIKESLWKKHHNTIMCGLSVERINELGGINANKYLAYQALSNGATEEIEFNIQKTVVVDDFGTLVNGLVDYIDTDTYQIERKIMDVPITHTDGAGMILPRISNKNFMLRLPWVKGLLSPFPFDDFCKERGCSGDIVDIYGKRYNIFNDDIEVVLTKSQFKMWKYYSSWQNYIDNYIKYNCRAGMCNEENDEDLYRNPTYNYQMLQTLSDMSDEELKVITQKVRNDIENVSSNKRTMLKIFGVTKYNQNKTYLQQALEIYPEMLSDNYCKERLMLRKRKLVRNAWSAKFEVEGKRTFIVPDLYAFCERLFLGIEKPKGLLADGEVYCDLFSGIDEVSCLRSPHLYREHAVRKNIMDDEKSKWFITHGLYVSSYDLMSKLLQCDWDGDNSLVCSDKTILNAAKRNMDDIVPLYYEMGSAAPVTIDNEKLYDSLTFAFANCNIGAISNNITKIWNSQSINYDVVKLLTAENNFVIDAAKTLQKLKRPLEADNLIKQSVSGKVPDFFRYAKGKKQTQVAPRNNSVINRLQNIVPNCKLNFSKGTLPPFDYTMLMRNPNVVVNDKVIELYNSFKMTNRFNININDERHSNLLYVYRENRKSLIELCPNIYNLVDVLVLYLYADINSKHKEAFWYAFGDVLLENLKANINERYGENTAICELCAGRFQKNSNRQIYCDRCRDKAQLERNRKFMQKTRNVDV